MKAFLQTLLLTLTSLELSLAAEKPNILFIAVDDLKPALSCYGDPIAKTPNFDRLAKRGVTFTNSHCNQAVCGPSRASLMTGLRPDRTKVHDLKTITREVTPWITTLPQQLKQHGYTTAGTGKIYDPRSVDKKLDAPSWSLPFRLHNLDYNPKYPEPVLGAYHGAPQRKAFETMQANGLKGYGPMYAELKKQKLNSVTESENVPDDAYTDGAIRKQGIQFMQQLAAKKQPFFLAVGFKKPHLPFIAPKKYWDMYDPKQLPLASFQQFAKNAPKFAYHSSPELRSYAGPPSSGPVPNDQQRHLIHGYYACVSFIDAQLGLLLDELDRLKLSDNTIVVLWGDHGWHLGDHGLWCKHTNYEQSTRSPLIIAGPGIQKNKQSNAPTEFVDIFPTLCDLTHTPVPNNLDGVSFLPILNGSKDAVREFAMSQFPRGNAMGYALRDSQFRYIAWPKNTTDGTPVSDVSNRKGEELYDYATDPLETKNIAKEETQRARVKAFREKLNKTLAEQAKRIALEPKS
ncbi:sulfatase [Rubritalea tangerina]|uniref:Sulfatase n=1 Tax=Rubritalea tangerina TaxID=430798 RepID=A0ABW4ZC65_9BACT